MKKVKKFGRGGDILTGLGAGLMGYALYKKLKGEDKDESEPESVGGASRRARNIEEQIGRKAEPKERSAEEKRALATSKGRPELFPEGTTDADKATMYSDNYPTPKPKPAAKNVKVTPEAQSKRGLMDEPPAKLGSQGSFKFDSKGASSSTSGVGPKNTFLTKERLDKAQDSMRRYREEQKKKQKGVTDVEYDPMGNPIMKKGGKVKKYNSGGTATSKPEPKKDTMPEWAKNERENKKRDELNKREGEGAAKEVKRNMSTFGFKHGGSASSRADGIAQRGKTRGRIY